MSSIFSENPDPVKFVEHYLQHSEVLATLKRLHHGIWDPASLRQLTSSEVEVLVRQNNLCEDWGRMRVVKDFDPRPIHNSQFFGDVVLGKLAGKIKLGGWEWPSRILNATLVDVQVGDGCLVQNVQMLRRVMMLPGSAVVNCNTVAHGSDLQFGIGKELALGIETGGRELRIFPEINIDVARTICINRNDKEFLERYSELVGEYAQRATSSCSVLAEGSWIMDTVRVVNVFLGEGAQIDGAGLVENCVLVSSAEEPAVIKGGAVARNTILQWGAHLDTLAISEGSLFTEYSSARRHGMVFDSVIGANTEVAEGEVTSSLIGSFVGFHHQALLIACFWPGGKGNVAYGANVGSNHTTRAPDQEFWPGEGMFFGLSTVIKYPADFTQAPYSVIGSGVITLPQRCEFPFSLINQPRHGFSEISPAFNEIFPAWCLSDDYYMLKRNEEKYRQRNKARRIYIKYEILRPSIIRKMLRAFERLNAITELKPFYTEREVAGLGKNYMTEENRLLAVSTYKRFLEFYCLRELGTFAQSTGMLPADTVGKAIIRAGEDPAWELARELMGRFTTAGTVAEGVRRYLKLREDIAQGVLESKQKDDERGRKINKGYDDAHTVAEQDSFVRRTFAELQKERERMEAWLGG